MRADRPTPVAPQVISRDRQDLSPWVTLETISVARDAAVDALSRLRSGGLCAGFDDDRGGHVRARAAVPSGRCASDHRISRWTSRSGESAEATATRELREETGYDVVEMVPLVECDADVGRLCNRFFGFFALAQLAANPESGIAPEPDITTMLADGKRLQSYAATGRIACASQIGLLYLAAIQPRVRELCQGCGYPIVPWLT